MLHNSIFEYIVGWWVLLLLLLLLVVVVVVVLVVVTDGSVDVDDHSFDCNINEDVTYERSKKNSIVKMQG
jgi:uncharacterized membrane protein